MEPAQKRQRCETSPMQCIGSLPVVDPAGQRVYAATQSLVNPAFYAASAAGVAT